MEILSLSPVERLTLANQFKLLALSNEEGTDPADYNNLVEILLRGYTGLYHKVFDSLSEEEPESVTNEVHEVLSMFRTITNSIASLSASEREQISNQDKLHFRGFDANNDDHYHQTTFMIDALDLYDEHKGNYINSHDITTLGDYKRQLAVFKQVHKPMHNLSQADLQAIATA